MDETLCIICQNILFKYLVRFRCLPLTVVIVINIIIVVVDDCHNTVYLTERSSYSIFEMQVRGTSSCGTVVRVMILIKVMVMVMVMVIVVTIVYEVVS